MLYQETSCDAVYQNQSVSRHFVLFTVDVFIDLTKGRGDITEEDPRNYNLKVLPSESITLSCTLGYYSTNYVVQWKREPDTLLYSSYNGPEIIPNTDPLYGRLSFSPSPQDVWVREWSMTIKNITHDDIGNYSCVVPHVADAAEGRATVGVSIAYDLISKQFVTTVCIYHYV